MAYRWKGIGAAAQPTYQWSRAISKTTRRHSPISPASSPITSSSRSGTASIPSKYRWQPGALSTPPIPRVSAARCSHWSTEEFHRGNTQGKGLLSPAATGKATFSTTEEEAMKRLVTMFGSIVLGLLAAPALAAACPPDSVKVGPVCVDKYEASVWQIYNAELRKQAQQGTLTLANLSRP